MVATHTNVVLRRMNAFKNAHGVENEYKRAIFSIRLDGKHNNLVSSKQPALRLQPNLCPLFLLFIPKFTHAHMFEVFVRCCCLSAASSKIRQRSKSRLSKQQTQSQTMSHKACLAHVFITKFGYKMSPKAVEGISYRSAPCSSTILYCFILCETSIKSLSK